MAYKYVSGFLNVHEREGHPDQGLPGHGHPDHDLPGLPPHASGQPIPTPPPGVFPPPHPSNPIVIAPPGTPPGTIWPPIHPDHPGNALPGRPPHASGQPVPGGRPDNTLPGSPPSPSHGLPSNIYWMLCYTPNLGWKFVAVDPSLKPGTPPTGEAPPTEAAPK
jgi:hypothetical protein